ncbi:DUF3568 family protein [Francisella orientalis]|uniref:DUF3568 family protein n=2 Tax=Francisella orientalis TaxID=299583 RepID=A0AAP7FTD8_9GAMM|nr:DUF3568 family protein [Francisella orientalis]APD41345.1 hypothetical protein BMT43_04930 [Francisella orientalis]MBK2005155.1 DUF3568 family protein [Francisella orientalis]MBK2006509.1 DUF3568 family protein [Francisella orientalis]MBK2007596.1 DUF3568 family protein [Francisella orientalis]MBK2008825.1 DUF3568 family protein [Francisella orientalis]
MKKIIFLFILVFSTLSLNSCLLIGAGVYGVDQAASYSENLDYSVVEVNESVLNTLAKIPGVTITKNIITNQASEIDGSVNSRRFKGTFNISIARIADNSSTLTIKYDIFGDKVQSKRFLEDVKTDLHKNYN